MDPYAVLGINKGASEDEIKKAYKKMAMIHHPDKGGDPEKFKEISAAYESITKPEPQAPQFPDLHQMFSNMFGTQERRGSDFHHEIEITLKECFTGVTKNLKVDIEKPCTSCKVACSSCGGQGFVLVQMGPFQTQSGCPHCKGDCVTFKGCKECNFKKSTTESEIIKINLAKGTPEGEIIVLSGKGEQPKKAGIKAGNLLVHIKFKKDLHFERVNDDLYYTPKMKFEDSIAGVEIIVPHFSGDIPINTKFFDKVIDPRKKYGVAGFGINPKGTLYIQFDVQYPKD